jgi:hypothetical protein
MSATSDNFAYLLNKMFPDGLADATYRDPRNTFLALVKKNPKAYGSSFEVALQTTLGGARSADFATAKANINTGGPSGKKMLFPYVDDFAFARVEAKDMAAAKAAGGVVDALDHEMKMALKNIRRSLASSIAGDGTGKIGRILAIPNTTPAGSFSLTSARDLKHFMNGQRLVTNPTLTGSAGTQRAGTALVTKVVKSGSSALIYYTVESGWAPVANDYVFIQGDYGAKINGVQAWIPVTAPASGDSFGGVDRSVAPRELAGLRVDASSETTVRDALIASGAEFSEYGMNSTHIILAPTDYTRLEKELEDSKRIVDVTNEYNIGLKGIELSDGTLVVQDPYFPSGYAYRLNLDTWELMSMGEAPHIANEDGLKMLRVADADAFDAQLRYWANLKCTDPSDNGVITLPA